MPTQYREDEEVKTVTVAFDVDGTMVRSVARVQGPNELEANEDVRNLMRILHGFKNVRIILWSGSGELWARQAARLAHIEHWVHQYATKTDKSIRADITIDDMEDMSMGAFNLIVGPNEE